MIAFRDSVINMLYGRSLVLIPIT